MQKYVIGRVHQRDGAKANQQVVYHTQPELGPIVSVCAQVVIAALQVEHGRVHVHQGNAGEAAHK